MRDSDPRRRPFAPLPSNSRSARRSHWRTRSTSA